jgi:hypothetical protein
MKNMIHYADYVNMQPGRKLFDDIVKQQRKQKKNKSFFFLNWLKNLMDRPSPPTAR